MSSSFVVVRLGAAILVLSAALALGVVWYPGVTLAASAIISALVFVRYSPVTVEKFFLRSLLVLLIGYALLGRSFANIGLPPVYVGEVVLGVGLLSLAGAVHRFHPGRTPVVYLLVAFMCWGALRTIPYLTSYGLDALRDAVLWGYGTFALLVASLLVSHNLVDRIPILFARILPWIIICAPAWVVLGVWTGLPEAFVAPKPGDVAVHLGGAAAFLLAMKQHRAYRGGRIGGLVDWASWPVLLIGLVAMGSLTRGGLLAAFTAILIVMLLQPFQTVRKLFMAGAVAVLIATLWVAWGAALPGRESRAISPEQIVTNLGSIGGSSADEGLENTRDWRLNWWNFIIRQTIHGRYFWVGKGFGPSIRYDEGREVYREVPNRSPHNAHLTVLARSGVPGLVLWIALQFGFAFGLVAGFVRARRLGQGLQASLFAWVLGYWLAFLVNATFDVYLEGPQGGIWFWCVFGYGLALLAWQNRELQLHLRDVSARSTRGHVLTPLGAA